MSELKRPNGKRSNGVEDHALRKRGAAIKSWSSTIQEALDGIARNPSKINIHIPNTAFKCSEVIYHKHGREEIECRLYAGLGMERRNLLKLSFHRITKPTTVTALYIDSYFYTGDPENGNIKIGNGKPRKYPMESMLEAVRTRLLEIGAQHKIHSDELRKCAPQEFRVRRGAYWPSDAFFKAWAKNISDTFRGTKPDFVEQASKLILGKFDDIYYSVPKSTSGVKLIKPTKEVSMASTAMRIIAELASKTACDYVILEDAWINPDRTAEDLIGGTVGSDTLYQYAAEQLKKPLHVEPLTPQQKKQCAFLFNMWATRISNAGKHRGAIKTIVKSLLEQSLLPTVQGSYYGVVWGFERIDKTKRCRKVVKAALEPVFDDKGVVHEGRKMLIRTGDFLAHTGGSGSLGYTVACFN